VIKKPKFANGELAAKLYDRLKETPGCPRSVSLAIAPSDKHGWSALLSPAERRRNPAFAKRFDSVWNQFRLEYDLAKD
jgi:hypothetical protein